MSQARLRRLLLLGGALLALPATVSAVCDSRWDGDQAVRALADRPLGLTLRDREQRTITLTAGQIQAFAEAKDRIGRVAGFSPRFLICGDSGPNAFAMSGQGTAIVGVTVGMMKLVDGDADMAAAVIGHEYAHHTRQHGATAAGRNALIGLAALFIGAAVDAHFQRRGGVPSSVGVAAAGIGGQLVARKFDRDQEREADELGLSYMKSAGYNPVGAVRFWERSARVGGGGAGLFFDTHPSSTERAERLQAIVAGGTQAQQQIALARTPVQGSPGSAKTPSGAGIGTGRALSSAVPSDTTSATPEMQARFPGVHFPEVYHPKPRIEEAKTKWSAEAHRAIKAKQQCFLSRLDLVEIRDGMETYTVGCHDGTLHSVRCDIAGCETTPSGIPVTRADQPAPGISIDFSAEAKKSSKILGCNSEDVRVVGVDGQNILFSASCQNGQSMMLGCDPTGLCLRK